ncbi:MULTISPECIES: hypothetical protein [unclassified Luteococcus]|uniref:hypothetical protein n=1 Tax=unclassified Luteococcus TaxID=2639923 RepID=UPI00313E8866
MNRTFDAVEEFKAARGQETDATWAARALMRLTMANVEASETDRVLARACEQVRESQEAAEDLFGSADDWAAEQVTELSEQGATFVDDSTDANTFAVVWLSIAGIIALLFAVSLWFKYDDGAPFNGWLAATPVLMGFGTAAVATVREWLLPKRSALVGWLAAAGVLGGTLGATVLCFVMGKGAPHRPVGWWLAEGVALFALAWLAARLIPESDRAMVRARGAAAVDDEEWVRRARGALRERQDLSEEQVTEHIEEARRHARESGATLSAEFGNPLGYAGTLPGDEVLSTRRTALWWTAMMGLWAYLSIDSADWWHIVFLTLVGIVTLRHWRRHLKARGARVGG